MPTQQYTIRNVPQRLDTVLRKRARLSGKSLNRLVIEDLAARAGVSLGESPKKNLAEELDWFIGSGSIDQKTLDALEEDDQDQKRLMAKEWGIDPDARS